MSLDFNYGSIEMAHGSGGRASHELINDLFIPAFDESKQHLGDDYTLLPSPQARIVMATDSHVISPVFFPGGDIGSLAIHGTVNDICMSGATPTSISVGFILEEGFLLRDLRTIVLSMAQAAKDCQVKIVTGDTKVVERGKGDGIYINTTGIGTIPEHMTLTPKNVQKGDAIIVNGTLGDHGVTIQVLREGMGFESPLTSDSQGLNDLVQCMLDAAPDIRCMRDPTRGGLASTLNEWAQDYRFSMLLQESQLPVKPEVRAITELLGLDPINIANEGKLVAICPSHQAQSLIKAMRAHPKGKDSQIIGLVSDTDSGMVEIETAIGGKRIVDWPWSDPLPRIC